MASTQQSRVEKLENFVADELAPVEGNVWTDDEGNKYSDKDCKTSGQH